MKLTWHIVRKDLRRMRGWLLAWSAVSALPILLGLGVLAHNPLAAPEPDDVATYRLVLAGLEVAVGFLLTVVLLQEDAVIGDRQWWLTRPVGRGRLLLAKALGALVCVGLVPIAVSLPWWWWCGLGAGDVCAASGDLLLRAGWIVLPAALIASVTDSVARAVLWTLVVLAAVVAVAAVWVSGSPGATELAQLRFAALLATALVGLEIAVAVAWVFLKRKRSWALSSLLPVALVSWYGCAAAGWFWVKRDRAEENPARAADLAVTFEHAWAAPPRTLRTFGPRSGPPEMRQQVTTSFGVDRGAGGRFVTLRAESLRWIWPDLTLARSPSTLSWHPHMGAENFGGLHAPAADPETERWQRERLAARGRSEVRPAYSVGTDRVASWREFQPSVVARLQREAPDLVAEFWFELQRPAVANEVPLRAGDWQRGAGGGVRIAAVTRLADGDAVAARATIVETRADSWGDGLAEAARRARWMHIGDDDTVFFAANRKRGEIIRLSEPVKSRSISIRGVKITWRMLSVQPGKLRRGDAWVQRPGWLDDAALRVVRLESEALVRREVRVSKVRIENSRAADAPPP
jgi:hypothetical protein